MVCTSFYRKVSGIFGKTGRVIGRHPLCFVLVPVLLSAVLATGFLHLRVVIGIEHLYAPVSGKTLDDKLLATDLFPMNVSTSFDLGRMTRTAKFVILLIMAKNGGNVFNKTLMEECLQLDTAIRALSVEDSGRNWTYEDVCAIKRGQCVKNDAGDLARSIDDILRRRKKIIYPLFVDKATSKFVFYGSILGGVEVDFEDAVTSAKAIRFMYYLNDNDSERNRLSTLWDYRVVEYLESYQGENIEVKWFSRASYAKEMKKVSRSSSKMLIVILLLVTVLNFFLCMSKRWTSSKPWMSVASLLCQLLSVAAAWGLCSYCGAEFTGVVIFDIFLIIGIGMKDTLILISAWRRTDPTEEVEERLEKTYAEVFISIAPTFLISLLCFLIGLVAPFRAAKIFCIYASVTSIFFFLFEITFLGGCLALSGYREKKRLHPLACYPVSTKKSNIDGGCYRFCCTEESDGRLSEDDFISSRLWEKYVYLLRNPVMKTVVILLYIIYLGISAWQCTKLQVTSGITDPFPSSSYITTYYERHYKYFTSYPHRVQVIINTPLNYSNLEVQSQVEQILQSFENSTYATKAVSACWLRIYQGIINSPTKNWLFRGYEYSNEEDFIYVLGSVLFKLPMAADLATDVVFNEDQSSILASRCFFQTHNIGDAQTEAAMLEEFYRIADRSPLPVRFTSMLFRMYELTTIIRDIVLWTLPISFGIVLLVYSVFVPSIPCVFLTSVATLSVQVGVIGFANLWGVKINSFYSVMFVMLVGLISSFLSHISYAFSTSKEDGPGAKMVCALKSRAAAIVYNCLVLIAIPALLLLLTNQVSLVFYKMFFLTVIFSGFHALVVLPTIYSLIFRFENRRKNDSVEIRQMEKVTTNREPTKT